MEGENIPEEGGGLTAHRLNSRKGDSSSVSDRARGGDHIVHGI